MFYEPAKNNHGLQKNPFKSCTVPRVIGWISTKNEDGTDNLAPYSQFTNLTFDPPMVIFASNQNVFGDRKNTVKNIERTGEFVYNMVSYDLKDAMNASCRTAPRRLLTWLLWKDTIETEHAKAA